MATVALALVAASALVVAQPPTPPAPSQPPTFRSGVDVVIVEATVVDRSGAIAKGLGPADFQVEIGGRARQIVSADLVEYRAAPAAAAAAPPSDVTTNTAATTSRTVLFVADQSSLGSENRAMVESARRWLKTLAPTDRVGLVSLPPPGPRVEFTTNHAQVHEGLGRISPAGRPAGAAIFSTQNVGMWEAMRIVEGDITTRQLVVERECQPSEMNCPSEVDMAARDIALDVESRAQPLLASLRGLLQGLRALPGQKHLVLLSAGWPLDERRATTEAEGLASAAAAANVTIHAFIAEQWAFSASIQRPSPSVSQDREMVMSSVETLAAWTGGQSARLAGSAENAFKSLSNVLAGYYRIAVRPESGDLDGRTRRISLKVARPGVSIRTHRRVISGQARERDLTKADVTTALRAALESNTPLTGLGLRATSYVVHEGQVADRLRLFVAADVTGGDAGLAKLRIVLFDANGKAVVGGDQDVQVPATGPARVSVALNTPPGIYAMRLAVRDGAGRIGSLERNVDVRWQKVGNVETTGLALFRMGNAAGSAFEPVLDTVARDEKLVAQVAFVAPPAGKPEPSLVVTVTKEGEPAPMLKLPVRVGRTGNAPRRLAQETLPLSLLPPGRYTIGAIVGEGVPPLVRTVMVEGAAAAATPPAGAAETGSAAAASSPAAPSAAAATLSPALLVKPARFETASVLDPARVAPILDQLAGRVSDATARASLTSMKSGPWPADASKGPLASAPVAAHFVSGLGRLQEGDLEGAANDFRSALRAAPDFVPAMAYLGACYAAGGKDKEAAAAWQTTLLRDRDSAWLHRLAIEAWLRADRPPAALGLIKQARQRFPDDQTFVGLQARALLADGHAREGLELVQSIKDPDESLLLLALATLYTSASHGTPVWDAPRDLEALKRWREAYAAMNGASLALVDAWIAELAAR